MFFQWIIGPRRTAAKLYAPWTTIAATIRDVAMARPLPLGGERRRAPHAVRVGLGARSGHAAEDKLIADVVHVRPARKPCRTPCTTPS